MAAYLERQRVQHGRIGDWPAWHVAPYASLWAIESLRYPGSVGWWVIAGDLPTDYISAGQAEHPREALRAISRDWLEQADLMATLNRTEDIRIGHPDSWPTLCHLLKARASLLLKFANDDENWENA